MELLRSFLHRRRDADEIRLNFHCLNSIHSKIMRKLFLLANQEKRFNQIIQNDINQIEKRFLPFVYMDSEAIFVEYQQSAIVFETCCNTNSKSDGTKLKNYVAAYGSQPNQGYVIEACYDVLSEHDQTECWQSLEKLEELVSKTNQ